MYNLFLIVVALFGVSVAQANTSEVTSLSVESCSMYKNILPGPGATPGTVILDETASNCPSRDGFMVQYLTYDIRGWLVVSKNGKITDTRSLVTRNAPGFFPYVGETLEWRYDQGGKLLALIFPVHAQDITDYAKENSVYFTMRLNGDALNLMGTYNSLVEARAAADTIGR